jgi:hypothetical protein
MNKKYIIVGLIIGVVAVYLLSSMILEKKIHGLQAHLDTMIKTQSSIVKDLALTMGRGGVNEKIAAIVAECPSGEANQYDTLLASLDKGLTKNELQGLNILFKRCGSVPASRRAGMSLLFEREVFFLGEIIRERSLLGNYSIEESNLADWNLLVEKEKEISKLFFELVEAQKQIISILAEGGRPDLTIETIQGEAKRVQDEMATVTKGAYEVRRSLISL